MYSNPNSLYVYNSRSLPINNSSNYYDPNDERIFPFAFPFLLGGVTGAALAPAFWNNGYGRRPCYNCYPQAIPYQYNNYYYPPYTQNYYRSK